VAAAEEPGFRRRSFAKRARGAPLLPSLLAVQLAKSDPLPSSRLRWERDGTAEVLARRCVAFHWWQFKTSHPRGCQISDLIFRRRSFTSLPFSDFPYQSERPRVLHQTQLRDASVLISLAVTSKLSPFFKQALALSPPRCAMVVRKFCHGVASTHRRYVIEGRFSIFLIL
jgi:hypothetical protein